MPRREYAGGAAPTTVTNALVPGQKQMILASPSGYPTGSVGPFFLVVDRGMPTEEKVLCSARTGSAVTILTRGVDGTPEVEHGAGASVATCWTATDADEVNRHVNSTSSQHGSGVGPYVDIPSPVGRANASYVVRDDSSSTSNKAVYVSDGANWVAVADRPTGKQARWGTSSFVPLDAAQSYAVTTAVTPRLHHVEARLVAASQVTGGNRWYLQGDAFPAPSNGDVVVPGVTLDNTVNLRPYVLVWRALQGLWFVHPIHGGASGHVPETADVQPGMFLHINCHWFV